MSIVGTTVLRCETETLENIIVKTPSVFILVSHCFLSPPFKMSFCVRHFISTYKSLEKKNIIIYCKIRINC